MKYTVIWLARADDELAAIWLAASDRQRVTEAARSLERDLLTAPETIGESRPDGRRVHFAAPLGILFRIHAEDRKVVVSHVWSFRHKGT